MKLIHGVPESLVNEVNGQLFISIFRIRALDQEDQWRLRQALMTDPGWQPQSEGWVYYPFPPEPAPEAA